MKFKNKNEKYRYKIFIYLIERSLIFVFILNL